MVQQYLNGVPTDVVVYNSPTNVQTNLAAKLGLYAQDSWTLKRLTLNPGIRWDYENDDFPIQTAGAGVWVPQRSFAAQSNVINWKNTSPRVAAVYDLFGNGKTALKASVGKYVIFNHTSVAATFNPMTSAGGTGSSITATRTWSCTPEAANFDCATAGFGPDNVIGPSPVANFGTFQSVVPAPGLKAPYSWMQDYGIQHQLAPGMGLSVSYIERDYRNLLYTLNLNAPVTDYTLVNIPDPRANGQTLPVYSLNRAQFGLPLDDVTYNSSQNQRTYKGVDASWNWRFSGKGTVALASSTGRTLTVTCQVADPNLLRFCDQTQFHIPFLTNFRAFGTYLLPYGLRLSGVFQSTTGGSAGVPDLAENYVVTHAVLPTLTQASVTVRLNQPQSTLYQQINQLDLNISKVFHTGSVSWEPKVDFANLWNVNPVLTQTTTYGPSLGTPQTILPPRLVRFNLLMKF